MADALPYRVCDLCGQVDDHPRHVVAGVIDDAHPVDAALRQSVTEAIGDLFAAEKISMSDALRLGRDFDDTTSSDRHLDCCASAGCPTGTCGAQVDAADGKTGAALRKSILKGD